MKHHLKHHAMHIAMCAPMIVIAGVLLASGRGVGGPDPARRLHADDGG